MKTSLDILVPCLNEASNLPQVFASFQKFKEEVSTKYEVSLVVIDNGSTDETSKLTKEFITSENSCRLIVLSRNFGKEASLTAGLFESRADLVAPIDADLQDPIEVIGDMLLQWEKSSADVILGKRISREGDSISRRLSSGIYQRLFDRLSDIALPADVGEFRLITRKVVVAFKELPESQRFVRGLFAWMGFRTETVEFSRNKRDFGKSRFSISRLFSLGMEGIVSFSVKPLRISMGLGLVSSGLAIAYSLVILIQKIFHNIPVTGYASLAFISLFLGGIQLFSIGVLGEYVGKTLLESKRRPIYLISEKYPRVEG
jgi:glycosyltransferase involved in cell wall biosynthesis